MTPEIYILFGLFSVGFCFRPPKDTDGAEFVLFIVCVFLLWPWAIGCEMRGYVRAWLEMKACIEKEPTK